mmetsp:Transcript_86674/g.280000  ORF Transcript_86674/g.280000 Transcript_86674/m.280000 type:complete len:218 (-) Transcript_86674:51-704(-)
MLAWDVPRLQHRTQLLPCVIDVLAVIGAQHHQETEAFPVVALDHAVERRSRRGRGWRPRCLQFLVRRLVCLALVAVRALHEVALSAIRAIPISGSVLVLEATLAFAEARALPREATCWGCRWALAADRPASAECSTTSAWPTTSFATAAATTAATSKATAPTTGAASSIGATPSAIGTAPTRTATTARSRKVGHVQRCETRRQSTAPASAERLPVHP